MSSFIPYFSLSYLNISLNLLGEAPCFLLGDELLPPVFIGDFKDVLSGEAASNGDLPPVFCIVV